MELYCFTVLLSIVNIFTSLSSCLELLDNFSVHPQSEAKLKQDASDTAKPAKKKKSKQDKTKGTEKDKGLQKNKDLSSYC